MYHGLQNRDVSSLLSSKKGASELCGQDKAAMPSSLRKLLQLKAVAAEKKGARKFPPQGAQNTYSGSRRGRDDKHSSDAQGHGVLGGRMQSAVEKEPEVSGEEGGVMPSAKRAPHFPGHIETTQGVNNRNIEPIRRFSKNPFLTKMQPAALKSKKKDFLNRKKQRQRGKGDISLEASKESEDSDPEERLKRVAIVTKPQFAEQAAQPISINLKRRHWVEEQEGTAAKRCTQIYQRQMEQARRQADMIHSKASKPHGRCASEGLREELVDAYRKQKHVLPGEHKATMKSLAALVDRETGA